MIANLVMAAAPEAAQTVVSFFIKGGLFMWPLLACSIVSVTTIILRGLALREKHVMPMLIESEIERLAPGASPERLTRVVNNDQSSLARIARVALQHLRAPRSENVDVVQTRARHEMVRLEKGLIVLEAVTGGRVRVRGKETTLADCVRHDRFLQRAVGTPDTESEVRVSERT